MKDIFKNYHFFDKCSLRKFSFLNTKHDIIDLCNSNIEDINFDLISIKNIEVFCITNFWFYNFIFHNYII